MCACVHVCMCAYVAVATTRMVYKSIPSALFYGSESWTVKASHLRRLNVFHRYCA